jgi:hypothetical protein
MQFAEWKTEEIYGFVIEERTQGFADLRFTDLNHKKFSPLSQSEWIPYLIYKKSRQFSAPTNFNPFRRQFFLCSKYL